MKTGILIIGGGASGLMAAYSAAAELAADGREVSVTVLEKMPRPARKVMITGKGRCNFTNLKDWNEFSAHIRSKSQFCKAAFYTLPSEKTVGFFESVGMKTVVERGDRAYPASYHASDVVDALVNACNGAGVRIVTGAEVTEVEREAGGQFRVSVADGSGYVCSKLIIATGGMSYPATGSTGDGYAWARRTGHSIVPLFPSLTALVPEGYKALVKKPEGRHIDRATPLGELGRSLEGVKLKNIQLSLHIDGDEVQNEFGDVDFTDGGLEGPVGFQISRKAVKALVNGSRVSVSLDFKPGVSLEELVGRVRELWTAVDHDPRSRGLREKEKCRILLGKLLPWDIIPAFRLLNPSIITLERKGRTASKVWVNVLDIAKALKNTVLPIAGYVGYERAVVTAGGVNTDEILPKTMESRLCPGLYFCGEILDVDCDTGGYNLQCAFSTGALAGQSAARKD